MPNNTPLCSSPTPTGTHSSAVAPLIAEWAFVALHILRTAVTLAALSRQGKMISMNLPKFFDLRQLVRCQKQHGGSTVGLIFPRRHHRQFCYPEFRPDNHRAQEDR